MKELLQEQTTARQADNSDSSNGSDNKNWTRIQLESTPFWIIGNRLEGYNIIMGKWKLSHEPFGLGVFDDGTIIHEAEQYLQHNHYNIILSMIICVTTDIEKQQQN